MHHHNTNSPELSTSTDKSLNDPNNPEQILSIHLEEEWVDEWGLCVAYLFGLINAQTNNYGFCDRSNKFFARKIKCSEREIEERLHELEEKEEIFSACWKVCF